jgi:uncharacterized protein YndB with AHSA1/START domain
MNADMDLGTLRETPAGYELRYERRLKHPPARVWPALTENEQLKAWFPARIEGSWVAGAALRFVFTAEDLEGLPEDVLDDWDEGDFRGEVVEVDPPRRLVYTWNRDLLTFDLVPDGEGCLLVFTTVLPTRDGLAGPAAGWHECLDMLAAMGDDEPWERGPDERWERVRREYERLIGPDPTPVTG